MYSERSRWYASLWICSLVRGRALLLWASVALVVLAWCCCPEADDDTVRAALAVRSVSLTWTEASTRR